MSRQPSTSTLFPYTTLFRSQGAEVTDSLLDPLAIVHSNVGDIFLRCAYIIEGHRNAAARHGLDQVLFHFGNNDGQARYAKPDHELHAGDELFGAIIGIGDHDLEALGVRI